MLEAGPQPRASLRSRRHGAPFDGRFFERDPRFWPLAPAAQIFAELADWPPVASYGRAFGGPEPVRFLPQAPRPRRRRRAGTIDPQSLYDAQITEGGQVPTRHGSWHDFLNALVWATFPAAKRALHARQHRAIAARLAPGATRLPPARTRELDALALIDEGGVLLLHAPDHPALPVLFGHALYEGIVFGTPAMIARAVPLALEVIPSGAAERIRAADDALARRLTQPLVPEDLPRHPLAG